MRLFKEVYPGSMPIYYSLTSSYFLGFVYSVVLKKKSYAKFRKLSVPGSIKSSPADSRVRYV